MTEPAILGPTSHWYYSQRLRLHYVDWGGAEKPLLLLIHGGQDHARNWDPVALALREHFHVIAPDLRGHGDSQWAMGGSYAITDFALDMAQLLDGIEAGPVTIIGHSLGGAVALLYTSTFPDRVTRVVAIEGLGPPPGLYPDLPPRQRVVNWIEGIQALSRRRPRRYASIDEAMARMQEANPHLTPEMARHLTVHGCYRDEDGTFLWKFDNHVRAMSPFRFRPEEVEALRQEITCPVLLVRGTESWASDPATDGRAEDFRDATVVNVSGAGHWVHHDQTEVFLDAVRKFLGLS